ncbi:hypothetical protein AHF37_04615 [Paragonimus kellicotti]|nr:hypothetical protein AHF37_04615 [Paragonimus kellicotti]
MDNKLVCMELPGKCACGAVCERTGGADPEKGREYCSLDFDHLYKSLRISALRRGLQTYYHLVCRCRAETRLETLRNTLKLLLSVLVNCPPGAESVISQTGPEFILSQLKKVHTIPTTDRSFLSSNPGTTPNLTRRWGSRGESPGMLSVSPHPSTPPSWPRGDKPCDCRSVSGCINNPLLLL